jgi:outer membrane protein assembly factor BamB
MVMSENTIKLSFVRLFLTALLGVGLAGQRSDAGDWPRFRGPNGSGVADDKGLPVKFSKDENVRWKTELPGRGLSNPVIAGGRVYVTASSGYRNRRLHVLCLDEATGKKLWERQFLSTGNTNCHPKSCMAAPSPVTDGKVVYALFATGDIAAVARDGTLVWYRSLEIDYPGIANQVGMAASPLLHDGTLIVPMDNAGDSFLAGLDATTGKNRWKVERIRDVNWTSPVLHTQGGKTAVVFQTEREVTAYDPATGKVRWTHQTEKGSTIPSPVTGGDLVFAPGTPLVALKPGADGTTPEVMWTSNKLGSSYASPLLLGDRLYALTRTGVSCVRARSGEMLWQQRIKGPFSASPVVADGKMYIATEDGFVTVLKLGDRPEVLSVNEMDDVLLATPAIANGCLYLRSDKYLYCIGEKK